MDFSSGFIQQGLFEPKFCDSVLLYLRKPDNKRSVSEKLPITQLAFVWQWYPGMWCRRLKFVR